MADARYTDDEVEEILRRALAEKEDAGSLEHEDLIAAASEVGIERERLEAAVAAMRSERANRGRREQAIRRVRQSARGRLLVSAILGASVGFVWRFTGAGPITVWAAAAFFVMAAFALVSWVSPSDKRIERELRRIDKENEKVERAMRRRDARKRAKTFERALSETSAQFEAAVQDGTARLLEHLAARVGEAARAATTGDASPPRARVRVDVESRKVDGSPKVDETFEEHVEARRSGRRRDR